MIAYAKMKGLLPMLDGSVPCVDCGKPAHSYDHRDYEKPLDVEPVCRSCNRRRPRAEPLAKVGVSRSAYWWESPLIPLTQKKSVPLSVVDLATMAARK